MTSLRLYRIKLIPEASPTIVHQLQVKITTEGGQVMKQGKGAFSAQLHNQLVVYLRNHSYVDDVSIMQTG